LIWISVQPSREQKNTLAELTLPRTTLAFGESGNRAVKEQDDTMLSYYPYDNVAAKP
jgi:protease II